MLTLGDINKEQGILRGEHSVHKPVCQVQAGEQEEIEPDWECRK